MIRIQEFFDTMTSTLTYVVWDTATHDAIVIDPVLDYDPASSQVSEASIGKLSEFIDENRLRPRYILETHAHADHLSGAQSLKALYLDARLAVGKRMTEVQSTFKRLFDLPAAFTADGSQFDQLLQDGERVAAGSLEFRVVFTPGHTPACCSYLIGDAVFTGDTLFMPDYGVGRCDFPSACPRALYRSVVHRLYTLPESTRVFTGHDYQPQGRGLRFESTIGEERQSNVHIRDGITEEGFVAFRTERDRSLNAPKLLWPSIQINIDAGRLPTPHQNGQRYLAIPISRKI